MSRGKMALLPAQAARSRAQVTALLAAVLMIATCSHKQDRGSSAAPALQGHRPTVAFGADVRDSRCADSWPGAPASQDKDQIVQIAFDGKVFLARRPSGHVAVWDLAHGTTRLLDRKLNALAEDGSVGLTVARGVGKSVVLEVWDLPSNRRIGARTFELGLAPGGFFEPRELLTVSRSMVILREGAPTCHSCGVIAHPAEPTIVYWSVATGKVSHYLIDQSCGEDSWLSRDGRYHLCVSEQLDHLSWADFKEVAMEGLLPAPDWRPPPTKVDDEIPVLRSPHLPRPPSILDIRSARLSHDGSAVYLTYEPNSYDHTAGSRAPRRGWRLEKWIPSRGKNRPEAIKLLASSPDRLCTRLLAVSPNGQLLILGGPQLSATTRQGPEYQASPLGKDTEVLAAAFSSDGKSFVTGHADGHLELWTSKTLESIQATHPAWPTAGH